MEQRGTEPVTYLGLPVRLRPAPDSAGTPTPVPGAPGLLRTAHGTLLDGVVPAGTAIRPSRHDVIASPDAPDTAVGTVPAPEGPLAATVRMGTVDVPLTHHVAVAYGLAAGVLALRPAGDDTVFTVAPDVPDRFLVDCAVTPLDAADPVPEGAPGMHRTIYGWFLGMPVSHQVVLPEFYGGTAPSEPDPALPDMICYLTGTVDAQAPSSPVRQVPTADGPRTMPSHQNTTDKLPGAEPHNSYGYFVVRGPAGDESTVRTLEPVPNSIPEDPLACAVLLDGRWQGLNSHLVVERGVDAGLLALVPLEYGGTMTTAFPDRAQLAVTLGSTGLVGPDGVGRVTRGTASIREADRELTGHRPNSPVVEGARRVRVRCAGFAFEPAEIRVRAGEDIAVELDCADVTHNLVLDELGLYVQADPGEPASGGLRAGRPGTWEFHCSLMSHREAGMTGKLVVES